MFDAKSLMMVSSLAIYKGAMLKSKQMTEAKTNKIRDTEELSNPMLLNSTKCC